MIYQCSRCNAKMIAPDGAPPRGWVVAGDLTVCGDCHRKAIGRDKG